jgi:hypothetical protein
MKQHIIPVMFATFFVGLLILRVPGALADGCSNASLKGGFVAAAEGVLFTADGGTINITPRSFVCANGVGDFTDGRFDTWDGTTLTSRDVDADSSTYTVDADCTGDATFTFTDGTSLEFILTVAKDGTVDFLSIDPGVIVKGEAKPSETKVCVCE